ncbi:MAG TPA: aminotransferase class I/II-fold pyridoxal phosphate-dependent enzyme [Trebonia sp.]|nr:aminotransferase class I/II-fold pyridoxal phosphate-dependent enzyme [Trebonia sp.]
MASFAEITDRITVEELRRRGSLKWTRGGEGVLGAFVAEMDFGIPPVVEAALGDVIDRADFGYLSDQAVAGLRQACAGWQRSAYDWPVDPASIWPMADVLKGLEAAIAIFSRPGSPVILPTPAYMPFVTLPGLLSREAIQVPMVAGPDGRLTLDLDGIDAAFRAGGHLLVLVNPCNPVGRVYTRRELAAVADLVDRYGGRVFADEIHAPLVYPGPAVAGGGGHLPYASISPLAASHSVTAVSASKAWNLPGLKCAQLIVTAAADVTIWERAWPRYEHDASTPGVRASTAAYTGGGDWLSDVLGYLDGNRRALADLLAEYLPGVGYTPPEGTYLAWLDCRGLDLAPSPAGFFLKQAGVHVTDGAECGDAGRGFARLNFATPRPVLAEMIRRMGRAAAG